MAKDLQRTVTDKTQQLAQLLHDRQIDLDPQELESLAKHGWLSARRLSAASKEDLRSCVSDGLAALLVQEFAPERVGSLSLFVPAGIMHSGLGIADGVPWPSLDGLWTLRPVHDWLGAAPPQLHLSVPEHGDYADQWSSDDGSGRQHWLLASGGWAANGGRGVPAYQVSVPSGRPPHARRFLACTAAPEPRSEGEELELGLRDGCACSRQWRLTHLGGGRFHVQAAAGGAEGRPCTWAFLSHLGKEGNRELARVVMWAGPPTGCNQMWQLQRC